MNTLLHSELPIPRLALPLIRVLYRTGVLAIEGMRLAYKWLVVAPVLRSVATVGPRLRCERLPFIRGAGEIIIGADVYISGKVDVLFAGVPNEHPRLRIGDRSFIGHGCSFGIAREVSIGSECLIGGGVRIVDNDGHPHDPKSRRGGGRVGRDDVLPVRICDGAWLAPGVAVLKGVTVGVNAIVGAGAVVTRDVPPNSVAAGNPARVIRCAGAHDGPGQTREAAERAETAR
jgi:acetyltransferase-like isoleucine patch superfamily enzyme